LPEETKDAAFIENFGFSLLTASTKNVTDTCNAYLNALNKFPTSSPDQSELVQPKVLTMLDPIVDFTHPLPINDIMAQNIITRSIYRLSGSIAQIHNQVLRENNLPKISMNDAPKFTQAEYDFYCISLFPRVTRLVKFSVDLIQPFLTLTAKYVSEDILVDVGHECLLMIDKIFNFSFFWKYLNEQEYQMFTRVYIDTPVGLNMLEQFLIDGCANEGNLKSMIFKKFTNFNKENTPLLSIDNKSVDSFSLSIPGFKYDSYLISTEDLPKGSFRLLEVDRRVVLPVQTNIRLLITSYDVIHSWAVPSFGVKVDAIPGRLNEYFLKVNYLGIFYGQCSEICGVNHGFMPIKVEIVTLPYYIYWYVMTSVLENNPILFLNSIKSKEL